MFDFMDMAFGQTSAMPAADGPYIPDAAECMRCGMCVSGCPTFRLFQIDEETPRRRIRTISKILVEKAEVSADELTHLNNCVQCRACEAICPSRMAYGRLFDQAQAALQIQPGGWGRWALRLIENKKARNRLQPLIALYLKSGLRRPLQKSGLLAAIGLADAEAITTMPTLVALKTVYPVAAPRGKVALFTGCVGEHYDRESLSAAIRILNAIGFEVLVPEQQGCCGAVHQHNGQAADALIANNLAAFANPDVDAVVHCATGCGAMLSEYPDEDPAAASFKQRLADVNDFVLQHWPEHLALAPLNAKAAVHEPCSQRNVLKNRQSVYALLGKIPGLEVSPLPDNQLCCGAGGSYMLSHPENAKQIRQMKVQAVSQTPADWLLSSNYACAAFLSAGAGRFCHPLSLIARQLPA
ncbi:(Fe-S)-binding protein [Methylomonas sp. HYX-M1]|uniref:(Fe-S)-binding protein n=1 Tax=Methylomonas sp. HYX-M1 TaxID=3139307 RepID=UPI00345C326E